MTKKDNAKELERAKKICDLDLLKVKYGRRVMLATLAKWSYA